VSAAFDAVTFDYWNTLVLPHNDEYRAARAAAVRSVLGPIGIEVSDDEFEKTSSYLFEQFNEHWATNRQFTARHAADLFLERHAPTLDIDVATEFHAAFATSGAHILPDLAPNVADTLQAIGDAGLRIGIVCDVGTSPSTVLRDYLGTHGVIEHFDHWSFSDEVGCYKPHTEIFEHALAGLGGIDPSRVVHVGDLRRTDVVGAIQMGMTAVRYRGSNDDSGGVGDAGELVEAPHVIDDHRELIRILGLD
jgi:putative hydrolase of the HAD superfamily